MISYPGLICKKFPLLRLYGSKRCFRGPEADNNSLGSNLLRSLHHPDVVTDLGLRKFCCSFIVFASSRSDAEARESALALNRPPLMLKNSAGTLPGLIAQVNIPGNIKVKRKLKIFRNERIAAIHVFRRRNILLLQKKCSGQLL